MQKQKRVELPFTSTAFPPTAHQRIKWFLAYYITFFLSAAGFWLTNKGHLLNKLIKQPENTGKQKIIPYYQYFHETYISITGNTAWISVCVSESFFFASHPSSDSEKLLPCTVVFILKIAWPQQDMYTLLVILLQLYFPDFLQYTHFISFIIPLLLTVQKFHWNKVCFFLLNYIVPPKICHVSKSTGLLRFFDL